MQKEDLAYSPTQWAYDPDDDDIDPAPHQPEWEAVIDMIMGSLSLQSDAPRLTLTSPNVPELARRTPETHEDLSFDKNLPSILTIAYGCLRGLTVHETLYLFGKTGAAHCAYGNIHPVRTIDYLVRLHARGSDLMSKYVTFPDGVNPLMERAA